MFALTRPAKAVWLLGLSQIIGYGSLYYGFAILSADIAKSFDWTQAGFFGFFSLALLAGGLGAPFAGRAMDRHGAARVMTAGSLLSVLALAATAAAPSATVFVTALIVMQVVSCMVLYDAAFPALVQLVPGDSPRRIVHLTLIAGFASSIFWPLTTWLDAAFGWRAVLAIYAAINLLLCVPSHVLVARWTGKTPPPSVAPQPETQMERHGLIPPEKLHRAMALVTLGFALASFALSAVLSQMVPLLVALGFGTTALAVSVLFGPAQVVVRFTNLVLGANRHPLTIALIAVSLLPMALVVVALAAPAPASAVVFVVLVGLCSGLKSIVQGTVPLALFGPQGFGARLGFMASFRYVFGALAPFAFAWIAEMSSAVLAVIVFAGVGTLGVVALAAVARMLVKPD